MPRKPASHPTDGELEILSILWEQGPMSLGDLCAAMREERTVATTTVATMLKLMLDKNLVRRKQAGRASQWSAAVTKSKAAAPMVGKLIDRVFDGSARQLMAHLIEVEGLSNSEISELRALLNKQRAPNTKSKQKGDKK